MHMVLNKGVKKYCVNFVPRRNTALTNELE